jgi:hypothetical protein
MPLSDALLWSALKQKDFSLIHCLLYIYVCVCVCVCVCARARPSMQRSKTCLRVNALQISQLIKYEKRFNLYMVICYTFQQNIFSSTTLDFSRPL